MLSLIIVVYSLYIGVKIFISFYEIAFIKKMMDGEAVILDKAKFQEAGEHKIHNEKFNIVSSLLDVVMFSFWFLSGFSWLENALLVESLYGSVLFVLAFFGINYIVSLPFDVYATFVKDKQFSTITPKMFITDQLKSIALFLVFGSCVILFLAWVISLFSMWWIWGFFGIFSVMVAINIFYPTFIAPLFNKFEPLENSELNDSIVALMSKAGLQSSGIFSVDASKRDKRLNAYFGGLGKSKRVVLYDTLIQKLNKSELLAVLGHELGHFVHKDIYKNIALVGVMLFAVFAIFGNLPASLFAEIGVSESPHVSIVLIAMLSPVVLFFIMPLFGYISRKNEFGADEYGSECESKSSLKNALLKLVEENRSFPLSSALSTVFYHTHPPLTQRLSRLEDES